MSVFRNSALAASASSLWIPVAIGKRDLLVLTADGVHEPQVRRIQIVVCGAPTS
jgi:hypothetical protein